MLRLPFISCIALLAFAGCNSHGPIDAQARRSAPLPDVNAPAPSAIGEPHGSTLPAAPAAHAAAKIPPSLQGRWALEPSDCSSPQNQARGLLIVTPKNLHFFESNAVPTSDVGADNSSIGGNFTFSSEGRSWVKYEALNFANHRLTRTEINPTASFSYAKCS